MTGSFNLTFCYGARPFHADQSKSQVRVDCLGQVKEIQAKSTGLIYYGSGYASKSQNEV